jgi:hypothetical protein
MLGATVWRHTIRGTQPPPPLPCALALASRIMASDTPAASM